MAVKPMAYWGKQDLLDYRERVFEKSRLRVSRAEKAVERAKRAEEELASARAEAERIEAGKARWDSMWAMLLHAEEAVEKVIGVDEYAVMDKVDDIDFYMRELKKIARGVVVEEAEES